MPNGTFINFDKNSCCPEIGALGNMRITTLKTFSLDETRKIVDIMK
ncbi:MAG: hypothetical protein QOA14_09875 [Nitrososphaeraceae archaeon]|nr:hypothetical protein [Nitrososphaeraceae archaeon]